MVRSFIETNTTVNFDLTNGIFSKVYAIQVQNVNKSSCSHFHLLDQVIMHNNMFTLK